MVPIFSIGSKLKSCSRFFTAEFVERAFLIVEPETRYIIQVFGHVPFLNKRYDDRYSAILIACSTKMVVL